MKQGIQGLKIPQVSLILIGLVCTTVLVLAWTNSSVLTAFMPSPGRVLLPDLGEIFKGTNISAQTTLEQVESSASSGGIELKGEGEDVSNSKNTNEEGLV